MTVQPPGGVYRFGAFTLDTSNWSLLKSGIARELRPKSFEVLCYLVRHPGRIITKDELLAANWPDVVVTEDSLTRCVSDIRSALEDHDLRIVRTLHRRGYRFDAAVTM